MSLAALHFGEGAGVVVACNLVEPEKRFVCSTEFGAPVNRRKIANADLSANIFEKLHSTKLQSLDRIFDACCRSNVPCDAV